MSSIQSIESSQDYVNYTFNLTSRGITETTSELAGMSSTITNLVGLMAFKTAEYLSSTESLIVSFGYAATAVFSTATQQAIRFQQALADVKAIGGESINEIAIGQAAMKYSNKFGMNVDSMTEGLEALSRAGLTATDVMSGVLEEGVKLSKLEGMDLEDSINNLISTTNLLATDEYDVNSQEYAEMVKQMNQHIVSTSESAPINAQNIIQSLQHVGGYASANQIDQEDLFAVIAQLGAKGTKGEMAGTALRAFIAAGQKDQAQRALNRIGLDVSDLWSENGDMMLSISEMKDVLDEALESRGYSKQEKLEFYSDFAGYKQANQIMKINTTEVQQYKESIAQAWDLGRKLDEILGTVNSNIQIIAQTTKNFLTKVGQTALPMINAVLQPIKWAVQIIDALPFSENIVGIGLTFLALKGLFVGINRVVPAIVSLASPFKSSEKSAENIAGHFKNLKNDAKEAVETLKHLDDPKWMAKKRLENDRLGMGSFNKAKDDAAAMFHAINGPEIYGVKNFQDLSNYQQNVVTEIISSLGSDTPLYQSISDASYEQNQRLIQAIEGVEGIDLSVHGGRYSSRFETSSGNDNRTRNYEVTQSQKGLQEVKDGTKTTNTLLNSTKSTIDETNRLINSLKTHIASNTSNSDQYDIGRGIMSVAQPLSNTIADAIYRRFNQQSLNTPVGRIQLDKDIGAGAVKELNKIFDDVKKNISDLPDISFHYDNDIEKMQDKMKSLRKEISNVAEVFSNIDINNMSQYQGRRAIKSVDVKAMGKIGIQYSEMMNEAYIREVLNQDSFDKNNKFIQKIYDEQVDLLAESLNVDVSNISGKVQKIQKIYNTFKSKQNTKSIDEVVGSSTEWYHKTLDKRIKPSEAAAKWLDNDAAKYIMETVGIDYNKNQNNASEQLQAYFSRKDANLETQWVVRQLVFALQKSQASGVYSGPETDELRYMIEHLEALNQSINRLAKESSNPLSYIAGEQERFKNWQRPNQNLSNFNLFTEPTIDNMNNIVQDFLDNGYAQINRTLPTPGVSIGGVVELNPDVIANLGEQGTFMEEAFKVYIHEMAHTVLQHEVRARVHDENYIPDTRSNKVQEIEARKVETAIADLFGLNTAGDKYRLKIFEEGAAKDGVSNAVKDNLVNAAIVSMVNRMPQIISNFQKLMQNEHIQNTSNMGRIGNRPFLNETNEQILENLKNERDAIEIEKRKAEQEKYNADIEGYYVESEELASTIKKYQDKLDKLNQQIKTLSEPPKTVDPRPEATQKAIESDKLKKALLNNITDTKDKKIFDIVKLVSAISEYTYTIMQTVAQDNDDLPKFVSLKTLRHDDAKKMADGPIGQQQTDTSVQQLSSEEWIKRETERREQLKQNQLKQKAKYAQERESTSKFVYPQKIDIDAENRKAIEFEKEKMRHQKRIYIDGRWIMNPSYTPEDKAQYTFDGKVKPGSTISSYERMMYNPNSIFDTPSVIQKRNEFFAKQIQQYGLVLPSSSEKVLSPTEKFLRENKKGFIDFSYKEEDEKQFMNSFVGGYSPLIEQALSANYPEELSDEEKLSELFTYEHPTKRHLKSQPQTENKISRARFNSQLRQLENSYKQIAEDMEEQSEHIYDIMEKQNIFDNMVQDVFDMINNFAQSLNNTVSIGGAQLNFADGDLQQKADAFNNLTNKLKEQRMRDSVNNDLNNQGNFVADTETNSKISFITGKYTNPNFNNTKIGQELLQKVNNNIELTQKEVEHAIALGYGSIITKDALNKVKEGWVLSTIELEAIKEIGYTEIIKLNETNQKLLEAHKKDVDQQSELRIISQQQIDAANANIERFNKEKIQATLDEFDRRTKWAVDRANEIFENNFKVELTGTKRLSPGRSINSENIELPDTINQFVNRDFLLNAFKNGTPLSIDEINKTANSVITRLKQGILQEQDINNAQSIGLMDANGKFYAKELEILKDNIKVQEAIKSKEEKTLKLNAERAQIQKRLQEKYSQQEEPEETMAQSFRRRQAQQRKEAAEKRINDLEEQYNSEANERQARYKESVKISSEDKRLVEQKLMGQRFLNALNLIAQNNQKGYELLEKIPFEDIGGSELGLENANADLDIDIESRQKALDILAQMQQQQKELPEILNKFIEISSHYQDIDISKNLITQIAQAVKEGFRDAQSHMNEVINQQSIQKEADERKKLSTVQIGEEDYQPISIMGDEVVRIDNNTFGKPTEENAWKMRTEQEKKAQEAVKEVSAQQKEASIRKSLGTPQTGYEDYTSEDEGDYSQFNPAVVKNPKTGETVIIQQVDVDTGLPVGEDYEDDFNYDDWFANIVKEQEKARQEAASQLIPIINILSTIQGYKALEQEQERERAEMEAAQDEAYINMLSNKDHADYTAAQVAKEQAESQQRAQEQQQQMAQDFKEASENLLSVAQQLSQTPEAINNKEAIKREAQKRHHVTPEDADEFWLEQEELEASAQFDDETQSQAHDVEDIKKRNQEIIDKYEAEREKREKYARLRRRMLGLPTDDDNREYDIDDGVGFQTYSWNPDEFNDAQEQLSHIFDDDTVYKDRLEFLNNKDKLSRDEKLEKMSIKSRLFIGDAANSFTNRFQDEEKTQQARDKIGGIQTKLQGVIGPMEGFNNALSKAAEIFPPLSGVAWGFNTALEFMYGIQAALEFMQLLLNSEKFVEVLVNTGLISSETAVNIAKATETGTTYALTGAIVGLEAILSGPLLIVIAAIVALIAVVYLSEKNHAEALKENKKALEESNKSMNAALANYKSLHQARLSATSVGKQRIAQLKESIALRKLEIAREKRLSEVRKKAALENDLAWGESGSLRADMQTGKGLGGYLGFLFPIAKLAAGEYKPVADQHSENVYQTMSIIDEAQQSNLITDLWNRHNSSYGEEVQYFQKSHSQQFAQMEAFAPQLQKLYDVESRAQQIYGVEGARDSQMFKQALQEVANDTGLNGKTLGEYLDYMQVEANVENARTLTTSEFDKIQSEIQAKAMQNLYGDTGEMGDLDSLQDTMLKAMVEDEARKAKRELFENAMMEVTQAIYSAMRLDLGTANKHMENAIMYYDGMQTIDENKERILQESKEIAEENLRKDYETGPYSIYGDTPFGGAVESARAAGMSVPNYSGSSSGNATVTTSNTNTNLNKASSDAKSAANTAKQLIDKSKSNLEQNKEKANENGGWGLGDVAKSAVSGALDFAKKYSPLVGAISAFFPDTEHSEVQPTVNKYEIKVEQININTEDDPEKIKSALMNLIIEMQEQITPRQVSRTIGELPTQVADAATNMVEGVDNAVNNMADSANNAINNITNGSNNNQNS